MVPAVAVTLKVAFAAFVKPFVGLVTATVGAAGAVAAGVTPAEAAEAAPVPTAFVAVTVNV